jgi:hypothetical protein
MTFGLSVRALAIELVALLTELVALLTELLTESDAFLNMPVTPLLAVAASAPGVTGEVPAGVDCANQLLGCVNTGVCFATDSVGDGCDVDAYGRDLKKLGIVLNWHPGRVSEIAAIELSSGLFTGVSSPK